MNKLLLPSIAALILFVTSVSADHIMYSSGETYVDLAVMECSTEEASLNVIRGIQKVEVLDINSAEQITIEQGCIFHGDPIEFTVNSFVCKVTSVDGRTFSVTMSTLTGGTEETFAILFTNSETLFCGE